MENAQMTVPFFRELCLELQEYRAKPGNRLKDENLSIFFHSLANYMLKESLAKGALNEISEGFFDNLVLNAPAVESQGHYEWVEKLDIQDQLYVCYNDEDINLEGLRVLSSLGVQLGERPVSPLAKNAIYVDFTESVGSRAKTGATHSYYYELITELSPNIRDFYRELFHGMTVNISDPVRFEATGERRVVRIRF